MKHKRLLSCIGTVCLMLLITLASSLATAQEQQVQRIDSKGKISKLSANLVEVETDIGDKWAFQVPSDIKSTQMLGSATPEWLHAGLMVRFQGRFNAKGEAAKPIEKLEAYDPKPNEEPKIELQKEYGKISFSGDAPKNQQPKRDPLYKVVAEVKSYRNGKLSLQVGRQQFSVPLAKDAAISVDVKDVRQAKVGDKIEVQGTVVELGKGIATSLKITAAEPLGSQKPAEKPPVKRRRSK